MCNKKYICLECNEKVDTLKKLSAHIRIKHNLTREIYYSKHLYKPGDGICPMCGNFTKFLDLENGYSTCCSCKCHSKYKLDKGYINPFTKPEVIAKIRKTKEKLGSLHNEKQKIKKISQIFNKFRYYDKNTFVKNYDGLDFDCTCLMCNKDFKIKYQNFYNRTKAKHIVCPYCNPLYAGTSGAEIEFANYIKTLAENVTTRNKNILEKKELDVYVPNYKLAFEYNGLYWHSERNIKNKDYHLEKTEEAESKNIQLIHIFEDEWLFKNDIVKSRISNLFGKNETIYARKCKIDLVNSDITRKFLNENHIQGNCQSKINYGLFYNDTLVALMTFGKSRFSEEYELLRFCNKKYFNVVGGASKLFKYFLKNNSEIKEVISYADRRWSIGNLYKCLNFTKVCNTKPSYYYIVNGNRENRMKYQKHKLIEAGFDKNKSEHQIMLEHGIYRIYDCGTIKFKYTRKS